MDVPATQRLSFKLACQTVLIAVVLSCALSVFKIGLDYIRESAAIDAKSQALLELTLQPASRIAYNLDYELAQELTDGLLNAPGVTYAALHDNFDKQLGQAQGSMLASQYRFISDFLFDPVRNYQVELIVAEQTMGHLRLEVDTYVYGHSFLHRAWLALVTGVAHALVMSCILLVLFYWQLTKPLTQIIADIKRQDPSQLKPNPIHCPTSHHHDELGVLVEVTNQHFSSLEQQVQQRQAAEQELLLNLNALKDLIAQRTSELEASNQRLLQSNQALELSRQQALKTAKARSSFLASMSHEIRTPLNGLLGMLELSLEGALSTEQRQQLNLAKDSGNLLMALLNDALDLSKFEAGQLQLEHIAFDPGQLAEETTHLLSQNTKGGVALTCLISPRMPEQVAGDPTRFRQILINLLSNALKFTERGSVTLRLDYQQQQVSVQVEDTGIGISHEQQQKIFEPFAQASADINRQYGGTGLGLALTLQLCDSMGGHLELSSQENVGSIFTATLPFPSLKDPIQWPHFRVKAAFLGQLNSPQGEWLSSSLSLFGSQLETCLLTDDLNSFELIICEQNEQPESLRTKYTAPIILLESYGNLLSEEQQLSLQPFEQRAVPLTRHGLLDCMKSLLASKQTVDMSTHFAEPPANALARILLVEDNHINQLVAKGMLSKLGYEVAVANNGREALQQLNSQPFDLVFMDCNMPIMDGYEACRKIRQNPQWQDLPVIALTASAFNEERERCQQAGMNDHLTKPFRKEDLQALLTQWLGRF